MKKWHFDSFWTNDHGWIDSALVEVDDQGSIVSVTDDSQTEADETVSGFAVPGIPNAHSHAFQYAMTGLAENVPAGSQADDFWSWRENMYKLALSLSPDEVEKIAEELYGEMLIYGYTSVAEFHYLQHQPDGSRYPIEQEISLRLAKAAKKVGIGLTLVPVYYEKGNFDQDPNDRQRRFLFKGAEDYLRFLQDLKPELAAQKARLGFGIHSLRAAPLEAIGDILEGGDSDAPFHIHISEQLKEVEDCKAYHGLRPVELLLDRFEVNQRFHLVHATHLTEEERKGIVHSEANVVLCPSTEANLGDGIFPLRDFHLEGGSWSIGSDSHIGRNPWEELRWLDYGQRLIHHKRNPLCQEDEDSAEVLFSSALAGGRAAIGENDPSKLNVVVLPKSPRPKEYRLANWLFSRHEAPIGTIVNGVWVAKGGKVLGKTATD